jgi:hypothetical protein
MEFDVSAGASVNRLRTIESLERRSYLTTTVVYSAPTQFAAGSNPSDLVTADLTNNGQTDVITSDYTSASIAVLMGNGNGTFNAPAFYPVGNSPIALAAGDINGDGIPDIVTANNADNTVSVLMGNGDGTFATQVTYPVGVGPEAVALADLAGNGLLDIVTANEGSNNVSVLMNNGDGTFQPAVSYAAGNDLDGLAVADLNGDSRPDIVTADPTDNDVHVLLNKGDGTFATQVIYDVGQSPRAVAIADVNNDGRPDIITANRYDNTISVLNGNGDGTFQPQQTYAVSQQPFSVAVADVSGDGRPDIITANNYADTVSLIRRGAEGGFLDNQPFKTGLTLKTGVSPTAMAVVDVNGDGRNDIITSDFNTNSISVLLNQTVYVPLIPTATTLTVNQNPVEVKNRLGLSVQITPTATGAHPPQGVVQFFDGDEVLGLARPNSAGVATFDISKLIAGLHGITAHYGGDSLYAGSTSNKVTEAVVTSPEVSPLVSPGISSVQLPTAYVSGERGVVNVSINDIGDGPAKGVVSVQLYASLSGTFDDTAFPITATGRSSFAINLAGGRSQIVGLNFIVPDNLEAANYTYFAALAPVSGVTSAQVVTTPAAGSTPSNSVLEFGKVGHQSGLQLTRTLASGAVVKLVLSGAGTGTLTEDPSGGIGLTITGTTPGSNLSIISSGVMVDSLSVTSFIGNIVAPTSTIDGAVNLAGVSHLTLAGASSGSITITGGNHNYLSLGVASGLSLYSAAAINSLSVTTWSATPSDSVTTAWIGTVKSTGDFGANLIINGANGKLGVKSITIGGSLLNSYWSIQRNLGAVKVGGVASGWSGSIHGSISSFIDTGDFAGELAAKDIGALLINGNLTNGDILAGDNFGADGRLGNNDDVFSSGILSSIMIGGSVTDSLVAAGFVPSGDDLQTTGAMLIKNSAIQSITVGGLIDSTSQFLSVSLPAKAKIDGNLVATAGDANFNLT